MALAGQINFVSNGEESDDGVSSIWSLSDLEDDQEEEMETTPKNDTQCPIAVPQSTSCSTAIPPPPFQLLFLKIP